MQQLKQWKEQSNKELELILDNNLPKHHFSEVIRYSTLPAGKLFRSMLIYAFSHDQQTFNNSQTLWASSIELHHTYTLIHDDLPAMDDDDMRRGRASSHKKFNEWSAILAGDALLALSFGVLKDLPSDKISKILEIYHEHIGAKGLILGQALDLGQENETLKDLLRIHDLKTAKLIQLALRGSNILGGSKLDDKLCLEIGEKIGINFQLLDDLCELCEDLGEHELKINPFLHFNSSELIKIIMDNTIALRKILDDNDLGFSKEYLNIYMVKTQETLIPKLTHIKKHVVISENEISEFKI